MEPSKQSEEFFNLFKEVRKESCEESANGYNLEKAIRLTFDKFNESSNLIDCSTLANKEWDNVGDDKLFPNHSDKDIWMNGFETAYKSIINIRLKEFEDFLEETGEDINMWDTNSGRNPYPASRIISALKNKIESIKNV